MRDLIETRVAELNTNLAEVSRKIGKNHAYLQQFIKRGVPRKLPEDIRAMLAAELKIEENLLKGEIPARVKRANDAFPTLGLVEQSDRFTPKEITLRTGDLEMPLYRFAHGGKGTPILDQIPFESAARPDYLEKVREPYGVMVEGMSMIPEFEPGWIAQVNPNITPRVGDTCIFRGLGADGSYWASVKRLVKESETLWTVHQHNPPKGERKQFTLKKAEYQQAHVVVGVDRRRR